MGIFAAVTSRFLWLNRLLRHNKSPLTKGLCQESGARCRYALGEVPAARRNIALKALTLS